MSTDTRYYEKKIWMYGVLTILYVMEFFVEVENYEECKKIVDSIHAIEKRLGQKLFTEINKDTLKEVIKSYNNCGFTGENAEHNHKIYADALIDEILNEKL